MWAEASCRQPGAPSPFPDDWGIGLHGRARKAQALAICRTCPVRGQCAESAVAEYDSGLPLYGIRCGICFADLERPRQAGKVNRLRALVKELCTTPA